MGKQDHPFPISGRVGKLTFYRSKYGHMVREARGISPERLLNDPKFQNTRNTMAEFSKVTKASKLLRSTLRPALINIADGRMISRLSSIMMEAVKGDAINNPGLRNLVDGDILKLKDFEFNASSFLTSVLIAPFTCSVNRADGTASLDIASFIPKQMIVAPKGATHFQLNLIAAEFDFAANTGVTDIRNAGQYSLDDQPSGNIHLEVAVPIGSTKPLFVLVGIEFSMVALNGYMTKLSNGTFNSLAIVEVNKL